VTLRFVDVGGSVDHHWLNFLSTSQVKSEVIWTIQVSYNITS